MAKDTVLTYKGKFGEYTRVNRRTFNSQRARKLAFMNGSDEREVQVLALRRAGHSFREIGERVGCSTTQAQSIVRRVYEENFKLSRESADLFRQEELERLDDQIAIVLTAQTAAPEEMAYVDRIVKLHERRAKLMGLDAASKTESTVNVAMSHEAALEQLANLGKEPGAE